MAFSAVIEKNVDQDSYSVDSPIKHKYPQNELNIQPV